MIARIAAAITLAAILILSIIYGEIQERIEQYRQRIH